MLDFLTLIAGFAILLIAGDLLVRGSVSLAERLGIPSIVIGLTIVAFGTSAPELIISLDAALKGFGGIAIGNVVGSNIANILLVLGMPALIKAIPCGGQESARSAVFMIAISAVFILSCWLSPITFLHGIVFLAILGLFILDSVRMARKRRAMGLPVDTPLDEVEVKVHNLPLAIALLLIGLAGLPLGGHLAIDGAIGLAQQFRVSETAIAISIIAIGTSLPELVTSLMAARKGHTELAMGNVIGSNVFNLLAIIGITAVIVPIEVPGRIFEFDLWVMVASSALLLPFVFLCKPISRFTGMLMLIAYAVFLYLVFKIEAGGVL